MNPLEQMEQLRAMAGPMSGRNIIGETTEALHKFLLDGYNLSEQPPRIEEELKFIPKDREEVLYIYMYRVAQNANLMNQKRLRQAPVFVKENPEDENAEVYYHRPPLLLDLFYVIMVHSKFRSDAERLMGWLLLRLNEATHLVYRPRRFLLPDGRQVDSLGRPWDPKNFDGWKDPDTGEADEDDGLFLEKVSLSLVDDLTVGDAINLFTLHEAPYRPFLTYRARVALDGPLYKSSGGSQIKLPRLERTGAPTDTTGAASSPNGRVRPGQPVPKIKAPPGPKPYMLRKNADADNESED
ncbi:MAG: Pvc16 family protein [Myxococcota bacterium]